MIQIDKPNSKDLDEIEKVLLQWTEAGEVVRHLKSISEESNGRVEYNLHFWVARDDNKVVGITGLSDPLPKVMHLIQTEKPREIKILYIDNAYRGKGIGKRLVEFIENEARVEGYLELLVRTAERYRETAWGFYDKLGYERVGTVSGGGLKEMQVFRKAL
jgi:GNAT superfamily N-acetyltransferase